MKSYKGSCHCGAIGFEFCTEIPPSNWSVRACQCSFCKAHAAACTSDPSGQVAFSYAKEAELQRYRFELRTADFLICRNCGVYIGAVLTDAAGEFATLNTRAMAAVQAHIPAPRPIEYGHESAEERRHRRQTKWTPVVEHI